MADYPYRMQLVVDPDNPRNVVAAGSVEIYDSEDTGKTTLLELKDPSGVPIPNPITSNANGFTPPFVTTSPEVLWVSGPYTDYFQSYKGMRDEAVAARAAAEAAAATAGAEAAAAADVAIGAATDAATAAADAAATAASNAAASATAAANAASLVSAPADTAVAALVTAGGSATKAALSATYAPTAGSGNYAASGVPSYAGTRTGRYDPFIGAYNFNRTNTKTLRAALNKARTGGLGIITMLGDSEFAGWGAVNIQQSIPHLLRDALLATGCQNGGTGGVPVATSKNDARATWGGTWDSNNGKMAWTGVGATLTFAADLPATSAKIRYLGTSGQFTLSVDGGAPVTITPTGASAVETYAATGLTNVRHTIVITSVGAAGTLVGLSFERSTGLRLHQFAVPGSQTSQWAPTGAWDGLYQIANAYHDGGQPHAVGIGLGVNDCSVGKKTPAVYKADMTALLNSLLLSNADPFLIAQAQPTQNSTTVADWEAYVSAMYDLADTFNIPLLDTYASVYGTNTEAVANGVTSGDGVHPNGAGYAATVGMLLASAPFRVPNTVPQIGDPATYGVDSSASNYTGYRFYQAGVEKFRLYQPAGNANLVVRDIINGRDMLVITPDAVESNALFGFTGRTGFKNSVTVGQGTGYPTNGTGHLVFAQTSAAPTGTLGNGGTLFVEAGALKYRGSAGTVTTIAPA